MKFVTTILLIVLIIGVVGTHLSVRGSRTEKERYFNIRASAFCWVLGALFLAAFFFLPNKQRILMLAPATFVGVGVTRLWKSGRARLREEKQQQVNLEQMKRVG